MQQLYDQWGGKEERSSSGFAEHFFQVQVICRNTRKVGKSASDEAGGDEEGGDAGTASPPLDPEQALKKSRQTSSPCSNPKSLQKPVDLRVVLGEPGKAQQERMRGRVEQVKAQKFSTTFSHNELNGLCAVSYLTQ